MRLLTVTALLAFGLHAGPAVAQDTCSNRGQLDTLYCDEGNTLVADTPKDPAKLKDPATLIFAYSAVEAPQVYQKAFQPLMDALAADNRIEFIRFVPPTRAPRRASCNLRPSASV